jgi:prepilin-type N-terminal cleavage/methylation domain-containing protein
MIGARRRNWRFWSGDGGAAAGFTLLEMLIVLGLFAIVMVAASDIFLMANRTQRKTLNLERVQADARYAIETIVREVRGGAIDYPWYELASSVGIPEEGAIDTLAVIDEQGDRIRFFQSQTAEECVGIDSQSCLLVSLNGGTPQVITPSGVNVFRVAFYIRPVVDPYRFDLLTGDYAADVQPRVTISLVLESTATDETERAIVHLQTTASSRNFRR